MFWKNFRRDLRRTATRLLSVIIITSVAVMLYIGLSGLTHNVNTVANQYYDEQNVAQYWITGLGFNKTDCRKLLGLPGIRQVQPRVVMTAENRHNSEVTLLLHAVPRDININIPRILEGGLPTRDDEMMVGEAFARAQGLSVGDRYEIKIPGTGQYLKMTVCALVKSPECINNIDIKNLVPDPDRHGFAYMPEGAVASLSGKHIYNQICITTDSAASDNTIKSSVNDTLGTKVINVVALKDNQNAYNLLSISNSIKMIVLVFPILFFAIAALIMFSTMRRLIENSRVYIGTFKALGYEDFQIMLYYLMYAILVVHIGFVLGLLPANAFTRLLFQGIYSSQELPAFRFIYDMRSVVIAYAVTCTVCLGTAFTVIRGELGEMPAECMRPKTQRAAGRSLLEKLTPLWSRFNFTQKYILRNIFRNRMRMAICVIGVAGCMALILTALGIRDSVSGYMDMLGSKVQKFDLLVTLDKTATKNQYRHLENLHGVTESQAAMSTGVKLFSRDRQYTSYFTITDDEIHLNLIDPYGPSTMSLSPDGVIIDKKIADELQVSVGAVLRAKFYGDNRYYEMEVADIVKNIDGAYVSRTFWRNLGKDFMPTTLYLKTDNPDPVLRRLDDLDFVENTQDKDSVVDAARNNAMSIVSIVTILIFFGGLLVLVVLYNLGIVSFFEQLRGLATLMVLGFYDSEIKQLVLTENIIFTVMGVLLGVPPGFYIAGAILSSIDIMNLQPLVKPLSYFLSGVLTLGFAFLVNVMLGRQMKKIDMLGALKSVE